MNKTNIKTFSDVVVCNPMVKGGMPVLRNTRFTVSQIIAEIAERSDIKAMCCDLSLSVDDVTTLLNDIALLFIKQN